MRRRRTAGQKTRVLMGTDALLHLTTCDRNPGESRQSSRIDLVTARSCNPAGRRDMSA